MTKADNAMEIIAYEMQYVNDRVPQSDIVCIPFEALCFQEYKRIYKPNETHRGERCDRKHRKGDC